MPSEIDPGLGIQDPGEGKPGATAAFPYDRLTVERFRSAFPGARWRDDLRSWFVPGTTAERRLNRWLGREMSGVQRYARTPFAVAIPASAPQTAMKWSHWRRNEPHRIA